MNINNLTWKELLSTCLKKLAYEKQLQEYKNLSLFRRVFTRKPQDPADEFSSLKKLAFEKQLQEYKNLSLFRRVFTRKPQDPADEFSSEALAQRYVQAFNRAHLLCGSPFGIRHLIDSVYRNDTVQISLRYQVEDRLPILTATYYEDGTAYIESVKFLPGGGIQVQPIKYPYSEIGLYGIPERPHVTEVILLKNAFKGASEDLKAALQAL